MSDEKKNLPARNNTSRSIELHDNGLNGRTLIDSVLRGLTSEQIDRLREKTAEKAIDIEVTRQQQERDFAAGQRAVETHIDTANRLAGSRTVIKTETKIGAGRIEVTSKTGTACFVATAAYGDQDHADVVILRNFRDGVLENSRAGRWFICWYWRNGPRAAHVIEGSRRGKTCARWLIGCIVPLARKQLSRRGLLH